MADQIEVMFSNALSRADHTVDVALPDVADFNVACETASVLPEPSPDGRSRDR